MTVTNVARIGCAFYMYAIGSFEQRVTERTVGLFQARDIEIALPAHPSMVGITFYKMAQSTGVPMGVEMIPQPALPPDIRVTYKPVESLVLSGKTLEGALNRLLEFQPEYMWREDRGVVNVLPRTAVAGGGILEQRVSQFELNGEEMTVALQAVHRVFDPSFTFTASFRSRALQDPGSLAEEQRRKKQEADKNRPLSVRLKNATIRDVLNAITVAHGQVTWEVTYRQTPATYDNCKILFRGFEGWSIAAGPRPAAMRKK